MADPKDKAKIDSIEADVGYVQLGLAIIGGAVGGIIAAKAASAAGRVAESVVKAAGESVGDVTEEVTSEVENVAVSEVEESAEHSANEATKEAEEVPKTADESKTLTDSPDTEGSGGGREAKVKDVASEIKSATEKEVGGMSKFQGMTKIAFKMTDEDASKLANDIVDEAGQLKNDAQAIIKKDLIMRVINNKFIKAKLVALFVKAGGMIAEGGVSTAGAVDQNTIDEAKLQADIEQQKLQTLEQLLNVLSQTVGNFAKADQDAKAMLSKAFGRQGGVLNTTIGNV